MTHQNSTYMPSYDSHNDVTLKVPESKSTVETEESVIAGAAACTNTSMGPIDSQISQYHHHPNNSYVLTAITRLFPGLDEETIFKTLYPVQEKMKKIWEGIDVENEKTELSYKEKKGKFDDAYDKYLRNKFGSKKKKSIFKAMKIIEKASYGVLIINSKNEVLGVQNPGGTWSAPKGYSKIKKDHQLETPLETCVRELLEEVSIKVKRNKTFLTSNDVDQLINSNQTRYHECRVDSKRGTGAKDRLIGLFLIRIDESMFEFELADLKENQDLQWFTEEEILNSGIQGKPNFYTLRPCVQYFNEHPELFQKQQ